MFNHLNDTENNLKCGKQEARAKRRTIKLCREIARIPAESVPQTNNQYDVTTYELGKFVICDGPMKASLPFTLQHPLTIAATLFIFRGRERSLQFSAIDLNGYKCSTHCSDIFFAKDGTLICSPTNQIFRSMCAKQS